MSSRSPKAPWIEAMLLELGAANVTTLEYNEVESRVDNLRVITPQELRRMWKKTGPGDEGSISFARHFKS